MGIFKKVEETKSGIKVLAFGSTGVGKTIYALSFPKSCAIDSEDGMAFYKGKNPNLLYLVNSTSADEVEEALDEVEDELVSEINTFIIDSETKIYENMQHSALNIAERRAKTKGQSVDDANISQREWGKIKLINKRLQSTKIMLASKGINVVSIAQQKELKEKKGDNWVIVGYAPDTAKGFEYDYDVVLRLFTEKDDKTNQEVYKAEVKKDRTGTYKKGDIIENPSYENWKAVVEGKANLKENVVNYKKDINRDEDKIKTELEEIEDLTGEFKALMKKMSPEDKKEVVGFSKDLGVDNPLKCTDASSLKKLVDFAKEL